MHVTEDQKSAGERFYFGSIIAGGEHCQNVNSAETNTAISSNVTRDSDLGRPSFSSCSVWLLCNHGITNEYMSPPMD